MKLKERAVYHFSPVERRIAKSPNGTGLREKTNSQCYTSTVIYLTSGLVYTQFFEVEVMVYAQANLKRLTQYF